MFGHTLGKDQFLGANEDYLKFKGKWRATTIFLANEDDLQMEEDLNFLGNWKTTLIF